MSKASKCLIGLGLALILAGLGILVGSRIAAWRGVRLSANIVQEIEAVLPERTGGMLDQYASMELPVMELDGKDYVGLLEFPVFQRKLPVAAVWDADAVSSYPHRFSGTAYDGSLVIGGSDDNGQLELLSRLELGDALHFTDMQGREFTYGVSRIIRADSADRSVLTTQPGELCLFTRDSFSMEYIIVSCQLQ